MSKAIKILKHELAVAEHRVHAITKAIAALADHFEKGRASVKGKKTLSVAARKRIGAAQKRRWALVRAKKSGKKAGAA